LNSSKIYSEVQSFAKSLKPREAFETAYVVKVHRGMMLSTVEKVFIFEHPNLELNKPIDKGLDLQLIPDNSRYTVCTFKVQETSMMHGFIGFFECTLYKDILMSIHPKTNSEGMFSWFPIVFPIIEPMNVTKDDVLKVHFWRNVDKSNVWYEWMVLNETNGQCTTVHNPNGRSYKLSL
jgi:protein arginine N-methyltransferase 5